jgi:rhamnosyltransferase
MNPLQSVLTRVCAVIVTYHPNADTLAYISKIAAQVQGFVVVDNGSSPEKLATLRIASHDIGFHLIENGDNLGIAEALNQGVRWAKDNGYPWIIFFDQDSEITIGFIEQMFMTWIAHPQRDCVASIQPRYVNPETGAEPSLFRALDGSPMTSMTSGTLMPIWIFDKIGMFASEYFMDFVDFEYSLRIRASGYWMAESRQAVLLHAAGSPMRHTILGFSFAPSHHSAIRRYYISRNRIVVYRKYFRIFPHWTCHSMSSGLREMLKCLIAEKNRNRKLRNFFIGTWDGLTGKMGKREDV